MPKHNWYINVAAIEADYGKTVIDRCNGLYHVKNPITGLLDVYKAGRVRLTYQGAISASVNLEEVNQGNVVNDQLLAVCISPEDVQTIFSERLGRSITRAQALDLLEFYGSTFVEAFLDNWDTVVFDVLDDLRSRKEFKRITRKRK